MQLLEEIRVPASGGFKFWTASAIACISASGNLSCAVICYNFPGQFPSILTEIQKRHEPNHGINQGIEIKQHVYRFVGGSSTWICLWVSQAKEDRPVIKPKFNTVWKGMERQSLCKLQTKPIPGSRELLLASIFRYRWNVYVAWKIQQSHNAQKGASKSKSAFSEFRTGQLLLHEAMAKPVWEYWIEDGCASHLGCTELVL